jgi:hypothetical protein
MPRKRFICVALVLVALIPVVLAVVATLRHWVPLPYWDEWRTPGLLLTSYAKGTLSFSDFFLQHNESRKAFPCFLYITLAKLHGWDVRDAMAVSLLEVAAICGLLFCLFLRTKGATAITALVAFAVTTFLCFSPVQYYNFLSGLLFELFFPGLAVILVALVNLSKLQFGVKTIMNAVVALVATYTFANGMLLWLLGVPLPAAHESASKRARFLWYLIFALVGAAAIFAYFVDYKRPQSHPPFRFDTLQLAHYMILWVGGYFNCALVPPLAVGIIVLSLLIAALANAIILLSRGAQWRHFYPWLLIIVYALSSGLITAVGRVGFGAEQALSHRYTIFSLFLYLGFVGTTFALYCYDQDNATTRRRRWIIGIAIAAIALAGPTWAFCFRAGQQLLVQTAQRNARLLCALESMDVFPTNPDLKLIFPYVDVLRTRAHAVAGAGLLHCHLLSPRLLNQLKEPGRSIDLSHGRLEAATVQKNSLITSGWIWSSNKNPNCVLIALRKPTGQVDLLSVLAPDIARPDIERHSDEEMMKPIGFWDKTPISMLAEGVIEAWAVDTTAEIASPLADSQRLFPHP